MTFNTHEKKIAISKLLDTSDDTLLHFIMNNTNNKLQLDITSINRLLNAIPLLQQLYLMENSTNDIPALTMLETKIKYILDGKHQLYNENILNNKSIDAILSKFTNKKLKGDLIPLKKISFLYGRNDIINYVSNIPDIQNITYDERIILFNLLDKICEIKKWQFIDESDIDSTF